MDSKKQVEEIFKVIDNWAVNKMRERNHLGASVYNPYNAQELAGKLYLSGCRKIYEGTFETDFDKITETKIVKVSEELLDDLKERGARDFAEKLTIQLQKIRKSINNKLGLSEEYKEELKKIPIDDMIKIIENVIRQIFGENKNE